MTVAVMESLADVIDQALEDFQGSKGNRDLNDWIRENKPEVFAENRDMLAIEGLNSIIRSRRKDRPVAQESASSSRQICIDFGIPVVRFDTEVSVPLDRLNPQGSKVHWTELEEASLDELAAHAALLRADALSNIAKAERIERLILAARDYEIPGEQATLRVLQARARRLRNQR